MTTRSEIEGTGIIYKEDGHECGIHILTDEEDLVFIVGGYFNADGFIEVKKIELVETGTKENQANREVKRAIKKLNNAIKSAIEGGFTNPTKGTERAILYLQTFN